jgi:hypothetical protein
MNANPTSPSFPQHGFTFPTKLKELDRPMAEILGDFIHGCSPDPSTRTVATTALVLGLWQLIGRAITPPPSMLLLRPETGGSDPIDDFIRSLVHNESNNEPRVQTEGAFTCAPIELAPRAMTNAFRKRQSLGEHIPPGNRGKKLEAEAAEERFRAAQVTGYGYGRARCYSKAWHPEYGLLTDPDDQLILRLNSEEDRLAFRRDLLEEPEKLLSPQGPGLNLFPTIKSISISGAFPRELWTSELARHILSSGLPFFVLPHVATTPLGGNSLNPLHCFAMIWQGTPLVPVIPSPRLPYSNWIRQYHVALRKRLAAFPVPAEFPTLQSIHELEEVCKRIVGVACDGTTTQEQALALLHDLFHHTLRGLVIGMASHIWFGVGLLPGEEQEALRAKAARLLRRLRQNGPVTKTELLKNLLRNKRDRDAVVEALTDRGLIRVEGDTVAATSYREFVEGLDASKEFPAVESQWEGVSGKESAEDSATDQEAA